MKIHPIEQVVHAAVRVQRGGLRRVQEPPADHAVKGQKVAHALRAMPHAERCGWGAE